MNKRLLLLPVCCLLLMANQGGCDAPQPTNKQVESEKAVQAANSIRFTENAEINNIKNRLTITADPGKLGFILLLNQAGQPIMYEGVKGKITSSGKRLTPVDYYTSDGRNGFIRQAASDEGTFGSADQYIYYWNTDGVYRQWSGAYLYSDQPIRTRVEPLVISIETKATVAR